MYDRIAELEAHFEKRYRQKKILNLSICVLITCLCIFALIYMQNIDREGVLILRWMTVDATIFTLILTVFFIVVNLVELTKKTELTKKAVYMSRLSSATAETLIVIVVLISQLPVFPDHLHIVRPDMFCMHIAVPILVVASFTLNDSPLGILSKRETLLGTSFVTFYAVIILSLIGSGVIKREQIPYGFMDIKAMSIPVIAVTVALFYAVSYSISAALSKMNRKLYWRWFK